jgi:hypothetical protein
MHGFAWLKRAVTAYRTALAEPTTGRQAGRQAGIGGLGWESDKKIPPDDPSTAWQMSPLRLPALHPMDMNTGAVQKYMHLI